MAEASKITCPDCGNAPVSHLLHKVSVVVDTFTMRFDIVTKPLQDVIEPSVNHAIDILLPPIYRLLAAFHLGTILTEPDTTIGLRERVFWEEGMRRGVRLWAYRPFKGWNIFTVAHFNGRTLVYDTIPRPGKHASRGSVWMDDKNQCHRIFAKHGIPMARGRAVFFYHDAVKLLHELTAPVITKPSRGSRSRHTTTHIESEADLRKAFYKAKQLSPWVIVEEELDGFVHRGTVIGGKVIGILRREPAMVVGDGIHTVEELIALENMNPKRNGPIFHKIEIHSEEHDRELARQGLSLTRVPEAGKEILLSQKASRGLGGGATDVTDEAHPDNIELLQKIAEVLEDPLVGVDFIVHDITRSWKDQPRSGVIECNSAPFIDLHLFPLSGKPRNTPGALWDLMFADSARK